MEEEGLWDFDDLLIETKRLLDCSEDQDAGLCRQFRYLLVDEFQDIDALQYQLICQWNRNGRELLVIGDPMTSRSTDSGEPTLPVFPGCFWIFHRQRSSG